jgi:hypothetical protein
MVDRVAVMFASPGVTAGRIRRDGWREVVDGANAKPFVRSVDGGVGERDDTVSGDTDIRPVDVGQSAVGESRVGDSIRLAQDEQ